MSGGGRLTFRTRLVYSVGEIGEGVKSAALETFLFFFYVQVVGLPGTLTGAALFIALMFDAVSDPMVGDWSDRVRTRLGRRHPFLYTAPVPLALALVCLFSPPHLADIPLFLWLTGFTILARVAMTLYFVPHMALGAELSRDFAERVAIGGSRVFFGYVGRLMGMGLGFAVFFADRQGFRNGQLDPSAYPPFAVALGLLVVLFVIGSALGTQRVALRLAAENPAPVAKADAGLLRALGRAVRSPSFRALFSAILIMSTYNGVQGALALHMNTYFWRLPPGEVQWIFYASMLGFMLGVPLARPAARRLDKKAAYVGGVAGAVALGVGPTILRLLDLAPPNGAPELLALLIGASFLSGAIGSVSVVVSAAMVADLADEYDFEHRARPEGLFFGVVAFCRKASLGVGGAVAGVVIDVIRFPQKAEPGAVPADALERLGITYGPFIAVVVFSGMLLMIPYALSRSRQAEIARTLEARA
ncbi:MFS transporter [Phenylobacterium sp.]|uniref:MFS transporter n=1 Tax=Phenylobacterium sp. TaxID=1871053 RepID=UPI0025DED46F|nr:MFS transporter [Phenylobacterium sp.]MBX3482041.1 MFS transporter [Phenylobacterium sp.]MCW5758506.1 MFS transporter [Phenylobacterium sp.]